MGRSTVWRKSYVPEMRSWSARPRSTLSVVITAAHQHQSCRPDASDSARARIGSFDIAGPGQGDSGAESLTIIRRPKLVAKHAFHDPLNILRMRVARTRIHGSLVHGVVCCVACLAAWSADYQPRWMTSHSLARFTCRTLSARRMSPLESFNNAALPSSVRFTLLTSVSASHKHRHIRVTDTCSCSNEEKPQPTHPSFSTTSSTFLRTSFSGRGMKRNLVHLDWIAGVILLT